MSNPAEGSNDYCALCQVALSGPESASQHYAGKQHRKKAQQQNLRQQLGNNMGDSGNGSTRAASALHGALHLGSERWPKTDEEKVKQLATQLATVALKSPNDPIEIHNNTESQINHCATARPPISAGKISAIPTTEDANEEFTFNGNKGVCHLCGTDLTSVQLKEQHLKGAKHKKAKEKWEALKSSSAKETGWKTSTLAAGRLSLTPAAAGSSASKWHCAVCNISTDTEKVLKDHMASPKHKKQADRQQARERLGASSSTSVGDNSLWFPCRVPSCTKRMNTEQQLLLHLQSHGITAEQAKELVQKGKRSSEILPENTAPASAASSVESEHRPDTPQSRFDHSLFNKASLEKVSVVKSEQTLQESGPPRCASSLDASDPQLKGRVTEENIAGETPALKESTVTSKQWQTWERPQDHNLRSPDVEDAGGPSTDVAETNQKISRVEAGLPKKAALTDNWDLGLENCQNHLKQLALDDVSEEISEPMAPPTTSHREGRHNPDCETFNCSHHCDLCDKHSTGIESWIQHNKSAQHLAKRESQERAPVSAPTEKNPYPQFPYYCSLCKQPSNTLEAHQSHLEGKGHKAKVAKAEAVPDRRLPPISKVASESDCEDAAYELIQKAPRGYQIELYIKAMLRDTVCFLPTGTGKTVISAMVISHMLQLNPCRPVVFLVDKVLLVIQQCDVLKKELGNKLFNRCKEDGQLESRKLKIAALCSGKQEISGAIWMQDVIVVTAAYYLNLLDEDIVRWADHSLAVFDEAHHCDRLHPFQCLLTKYHCTLPLEQRPKILGLTASPAGKETIAKTEKMLDRLLENMGGISLVTVEEEPSVRELAKHKSNAMLQVLTVKLGEKEIELQEYLTTGLMNCLEWLKRENTLEKCPVKADLFEHSGQLSPDGQQFFESGLTTVKTSASDNQAQAVVIFAQTLCAAYVILNGLGYLASVQELRHLWDEDSIGKLNEAEGIIVPELQRLVTSCTSEDAFHTDEELLDCMPAVRVLTSKILSVKWEKTNILQPIVLVLMRQRKHALALEKILKNLRCLSEKDLKVVSLVGHGTTGNSDARGMSVRKQDRVLREIKERKYQIIVATSVAEEGVDMPTCELVVQLDPPSCVKALVQLRGRARQKQSCFLVICRSENEAHQIEDLLRREQFMVEAAKNIMIKQKQNRPNR